MELCNLSVILISAFLLMHRCFHMNFAKFLNYHFYRIPPDDCFCKLYYNAAVRHFLKTFKKFAGTCLWWKPFLGKFNLFKMDSGKGFFLSVFRTPFYICFRTLNRSVFLWKITLFGANTPESSKICQKVEDFPY